MRGLPVAVMACEFVTTALSDVRQPLAVWRLGVRLLPTDVASKGFLRCSPPSLYFMISWHHVHLHKLWHLLSSYWCLILQCWNRSIQGCLGKFSSDFQPQPTCPCVRSHTLLCPCPAASPGCPSSPSSSGALSPSTRLQKFLWRCSAGPY